MRPTGRRLVRLSLAALGVVYGNIGPSPLYAFRECFKPEYGLAPTASNVYGVLSLIVWSLILIVSVKYLVLIIRLDNRGEGGIMALLALVLSIRRRQAVIAIGLFGAALLYGDGIITPAISVLGAVVLAVTGAEALYADLGHFGRRPIRLAWFAFVLPALLLNYFGQGGLVLSTPEAIESPFYLLAPRVLLYPLVGIATAATIVASQALISGAFSLTQQSVHLRYLPRLSIIHTSRSEFGQIYVPAVDRKSTRLNSSHGYISYAVFCLKKKNTTNPA